MTLSELVAATLAARDAPDSSPTARKDGAGSMPAHSLPLVGAKRRPVFVQVMPNRRRRRLHPLAIAAAILVAFCGALYGARSSGWSAVLITKLEANLWPRQSEPPARPLVATTDHSIAGPATDAVPPQRPPRASPADDMRRGLAAYQQLMLGAAGAEVSPPAQTASPETHDPAAPLQQEQAAPSRQDQAERASPPRRPASRRAPARYTAPQREYPTQQNYWNAPGYTAR